MRALNVTEQTTVDRGKYFAAELLVMAAPRGILVFRGAPDRVVRRIRDLSRALLTALEDLEREQARPTGKGD